MIPQSASASTSQRRFRPWAGYAQQGQSSAEYILICVALIAALGVGMLDDASVLKKLVSAFFEAFANYSYAISLPE